VETLPTNPGVAVGVAVAVAVGVGVGPGLTVTVKVQFEALPVESDTVLVTVVVPTGNDEPEDGFDVGLPTPGQLSLTVGSEKVTTALFCPVAACVVMLAGHVIFGNWLSSTVTSNEQEAPVELLAVTVVLPFGKKEPLGGEVVSVPQLPDPFGVG